MIVIVDANIVFSAILNTNGKVGDLILNSDGIIDFIAPRYMDWEILKYQDKILKITKKSSTEIKRIHFKIMKKISFFSEEQIPMENRIKAYDIVKNIDPKDTPYIAFSDFLKLKIWTGDKELSKGLLDKGYKITISTNELYKYREEMSK